MTTRLQLYTTFLPSFGIFEQEQSPIGIYTVLSINESANDCAAYRGIVPDISMMKDKAAQATLESDLIERVRAGGNKISKEEAIRLFPIIQEKSLRYRS